MLNLCLLLLLNSFLIIGFFEASQEGMVLFFIRKNTQWIPGFWRKPIYDCPTCMASVHSSYVFYSFYPFNLEDIGFYLIYVLALAGLTFFINRQIPE